MVPIPRYSACQLSSYSLASSIVSKSECICSLVVLNVYSSCFISLTVTDVAFDFSGFLYFDIPVFSDQGTEFRSLLDMGCLTRGFGNSVAAVAAYNTLFRQHFTELILGTTPCATLLIEGMIDVSSLHSHIFRGDRGCVDCLLDFGVSCQKSSSVFLTSMKDRIVFR